MANVKTVYLTGSEVELSGLGGQNVEIKNLSDSSVYASAYPDIVPDADNVVEIPAGWGEVVLDTRGTVYLLGVGKVQCKGTDFAYPNFNMPSSSESGGGGGTGDATKGYVDAQDAINLASAKGYTDTAVGAVKDDVAQNTADIAELQADVTATQQAASTAQNTAEAAQNAAEAAHTKADTNTGDISALQISVAAAEADIAANKAAIIGNNSDIGALQGEISAVQGEISTNTADIAENRSDIEALQSNILTVQGEIAAKSLVSEEGAFDARIHNKELEAFIDGKWTKIGTGGSSEGGVSQDYVDRQDEQTLTAAKEYSDGKVQPLQETVGQHSDTLSTLTGSGEGSVNATVAAGVEQANNYTDEQISAMSADISALQTDKADKTEIPIVSNPNLLDNWDFADPINQRGETKYTEAGYTIDRWRTSSPIQVELTNEGVVLQGEYGQSFVQRVANAKLFAGQQYSFSVLLKGNAKLLVGINGAYPKSASYNNSDIGICQFTYKFPKTITSDYVSFIIQLQDNKPCTLIVPKLEPGDQQTAAHQDESGEWVRNDPPPNKALELAKCQRFYEVTKIFHLCYHKYDTTVQWMVEKRANPAVTIQSIAGTKDTVSYYKNNGWVDLETGAGTAAVDGEDSKKSIRVFTNGTDFPFSATNSILYVLIANADL